MVAIYILWHRVMTTDVHRPRAAEIIDRFATELEAPSVEAFAVRLLLGADIDWTTDQFDELADERRRNLERGRGQPLPPRFDTALEIAASRLSWDDGRSESSVERMGRAVESLPGNQALLALEEALMDGRFLDFDLRRFVLGADDWVSADSDAISSGEAGCN